MRHSGGVADWNGRNLFVDAIINVTNAKHLTSSAEIRGDQGVNTEGLVIHGIRFHGIQQRSYAFICTEQLTKPKSIQRQLIEYGKRLPGDSIIRFQIQNSSNPKIQFNFHDPLIKLSYVSVAVNVRPLK